ncbi:MAG: M15 family metallopeptidase [Candidatus Coprovivens sp.]
MAQKRKKKKKYRLRYEFKKFLVYFIFFLGMGIYTIKESIKLYEEFEYQKTYEYKIEQIGYSKEETTKLIEILSEEKLNFILDNEYNEIYYNIVTQKYYLEKNFDKYIEYKTYHEDTSYEDTIAIVNVHANVGWYNETYPTNIEDNYLILVNKFYYLPENYERDDIESISLQYSYDNNKAASIVIENFKIMKQDIENELGVHLMVNSSYRPYKDQEEIYNEYKKKSLKYADSYAARPGHSEHQTGLSIDLTSLEHPYINNSENSFDKSEEYEWLKNNCHKYGFILRYPEGKDYLTGYNTESWHFRYVGEKVATQIFQEGITFDEYYAYYIEK